VGIKAAICTLGCKVNQYESQAIAEGLEKIGYEMTEFDGYSDLYVINTCTVTAESDRKSRQMISRAHRHNPGACIVVCGCYSEAAGEKLAENEYISAIFGTRNKNSVVDFAKEYFEKNAVFHRCIDNHSNEMPYEKMRISKSERTRAYIKIEDGCDSHCSYCAIKNARGRVVSRELGDTLEEVRSLVASGYKEIVLSGVEISAYGKDLENTDLFTLLSALDSVEGLERVRLGSLAPELFSYDFIDKISTLKHLAPYFHISLQSGSDRVLAAMKRKYSFTRVLPCIEYLKKKIPNATLGADIIAGFPGESELDLEKSVSAVAELGMLNTHVFKFSPREGTEAAQMRPRLTDVEKSRRVRIISESASLVRAETIARFCEEGRIHSVIFEEYKNGILSGYTENYIYVSVRSEQDLRGNIHKVRLVSYDKKSDITHAVLV